MGVSVLFEVDKEGLTKRAPIALGAAAPNPVRVFTAEEVLQWRGLSAAHRQAKSFGEGGGR